MVFQHRSLTEKDKVILSILQTRAWIIHCMYSIVKIFLWTSGKSIWLSTVPSCSDIYNLEEETQQECVPFEYNVDRVNSLRFTIKYVSMVMTIFACLLDLAIYKKRSLANLIYYIELFHLGYISIIPSITSVYTDFYSILLHYFFFTAFYCDTSRQIVFGVVS